MWIGSYIFGLLADKYGRTKILSFSIILFAVATFLMYFVDNYTVLLFYVLSLVLVSVVNLVLVWRLLLKHGHLICEQELTSWVALGWQGGVLLAAVIPGYNCANVWLACSIFCRLKFLHSFIAIYCTYAS